MWRTGQREGSPDALGRPPNDLVAQENERRQDEPRVDAGIHDPERQCRSNHQKIIGSGEPAVRASRSSRIEQAGNSHPCEGRNPNGRPQWGRLPEGPQRQEPWESTMPLGWRGYYQANPWSFARRSERSRAPRPVGLAGIEPNRKSRKRSKILEAALMSLRSPCSRKEPRRRSRASFRSPDDRNAGTSESIEVAV